jgi:hypothetical protein
MSLSRPSIASRSGARGTAAGVRRRSIAHLAILAPVLILAATGCVTKFQTGAPLRPEQSRIVISDLAVAGVLARKEDANGTNLPDAAARLAKISGVPDRSSTLSESDLATLLESPSAIRDAAPRLRDFADRIGHRYALVGEAGTAPTDEQKSWIIQIVIPIPYLWISFGIPVRYASNVDVPHSTVSARIVDLQRGEVVAASFEVGSDIDTDETPEFESSAAKRAIERMALERP